jgi:hypothetical protein
MRRVRKSAILFIIAVSASLFTVGCASSESQSKDGIVSGQRWAWEGQETWANEVVSVSVAEENVFVIFGELLSGSSPNFVLFVRRDCVTENPVYSRWDAPDIVRYYRGHRDSKEREDWEYSLIDRMPRLSIRFRRRKLGYVIQYLCQEIDYGVGYLESDHRLFLGPREMMDSHCLSQRRVYKMTDRRDWFDHSSLPARLPPCGPGFAFDAETGRIVIIGDSDHFSTFECLLHAIGAELTSSSEDASW